MALLNRRAAGNALLVAATIVFSLIVMEFGARYLLADIGTSGDRGTYLSRRWYAENPVRMNRLGFREGEVTPAAAPGVFRIALVGDSFTFAPGISEDDRTSNRLEAGLNAGMPPKFEVLNFGQPGAGYEQHQQNLQLAVESSKPDYVLLQWYLNDLDDPADHRPRPYQLGWVVHHELSAASVLYFLASRVFADAQIRLGGMDVDGYYARFLDPGDPISRRADQRLRDVLDVARRAGVPVGLYIWPELTRPLGTSPNDALIERLLATCRRERIDCVDLRPALRREPKHERLIVNRFDTHASAQANVMAADLLLARLGPTWRTAAAIAPSGYRD